MRPIGPNGCAPRDPATRFWEKVNKDGPVIRAELGPYWIWTGSTFKANGYGQFNAGRGKMRTAHRASWELCRGAIPDGLWVLHKCDNHRCVNPDHLFLGTRADNIADMVAKKRHFRPKLTEEAAAEIRRLSDAGMSYAEIGRRFGISDTQAGNVAKGRQWAA